LPFLILGYVDYVVNLICKSLASGCIIFIIPSLLFLPITFLYGLGGTFIVLLKYQVIGQRLTFIEAQTIFLSNFPKL
jgi:hypothetical protein